MIDQKMTRIRKKTDIELIMKEMLGKNKIDFVEEYPIRCKYGYVLDFAIPNLKIDIECDGSYWHKEGNKHDRRRNWYLRSLGWEIIRFSDKDIKEDIDDCIFKLKKLIERRLKENEDTSKDKRDCTIVNA